MEELANYGCLLPPEMMGLTDEQIEELKLVDNWAETCIPSGGFNHAKDPVGRRNGRQPTANMQEVLRNSIANALEMIDKKLVDQNKFLTHANVKEALDLLKGAVTIVYPMQLPPHDTIRNEFHNTEDLTGTQASLEVIEPAKAQLWFAGKQMLPDRKLGDFVGNNEKCKVIVKLQKSDEGPPGREPAFTEAERKQMTMLAYRRQEEMKRLEQDDGDDYLDSSWANNNILKSQMHGINDIKFRMGK
jgi:cilia- and flagella-associated protein 298